MQHSDEFIEEWKTIEGFENYEVSNLGRVRRVEYIKQRKVEEEWLVDFYGDINRETVRIYWVH